MFLFLFKYFMFVRHHFCFWFFNFNSQFWQNCFNIPIILNNKFLMMASTLLRIPAPQQRWNFPENFCWPSSELSLKHFTMSLQEICIDLIFTTCPRPYFDILFANFSTTVCLCVNYIIIIFVILFLCFIFEWGHCFFKSTIYLLYICPTVCLINYLLLSYKMS